MKAIMTFSGMFLKRIQITNLQSHLYANFIVKPAVKSSGPFNPAIDKKDIPTDEETWLA